MTSLYAAVSKIGRQSRRKICNAISLHASASQRIYSSGWVTSHDKLRHKYSNRQQTVFFSALSTQDKHEEGDDIEQGESSVEIIWAHDEEKVPAAGEADTPSTLATPSESIEYEDDGIKQDKTSLDLDWANDEEVFPETADTFATFVTTSDSTDFKLSSQDDSVQSQESSSSSLDVPSPFDTQSDDTSSFLNGPSNDLDKLFNSDIFEESWRGKEIFDTSKRMGRANESVYTVFGKTSPSSYGVAERPIDNPSGVIEKRYNELLQQTHDLLEALPGEDAFSTTLQLMDFDNVMVQWSQFHSEVDGNKGDKSTSYGEGSSDYFVTRQNVNDNDLKLRASHNCMRLLNALEKNYDDIYEHNKQLSSDAGCPKHSEVFPNAATYNLALNALANSSTGTLVADEAYLILVRMLDRCRQYRDSASKDKKDASHVTNITAPPEPTIITYNSVIHAIAKSGAADAGFLAEDVFNQMEAWKKENDQKSDSNHQTSQIYHGVYPNSRTLACVLDAWANTKTVHGQTLVPERSTVIIETALDKRREYVRSIKGVEDDRDFTCDDDEEKSDLFSFMDDENKECLVNGDITEEIIHEEDLVCNIAASSEDYAETSVSTEEERAIEPFLKPNIVSFNTVLHAWSVSKLGYQGALRAHQLLDKIENLSETDHLDVPDGYQDPTVASVDVDDVLLETSTSLKPNARTYSALMNSWANVVSVERRHGEDAASKCEQILEKMEERGRDDVSVRPNLITYINCISAWARVRKSEKAASRAEHILNRMIDLYYNEKTNELPALEGDLKHAQHDAPFNSVITAYARSNDPAASDRALAILDRLEASPIEPTAITYNAVMDSCAKNGEADRALSVLQRMKDKSIYPDPTSYNTILNAFARDDSMGSAERAWQFLQQLEEDRMNGSSNFIPTNFSYSSVINAFARASGRLDGGIHVVERAKEVYDKLILQIKEGKSHINVDAFANSCLLNCCANVNGPAAEKRAALILAINAFEDLKRNPNIHGEPNQYTFGTMMKVSSRLSTDPEEKNRLMENIFIQACNRGFLSSSVLGQFLKNVPSHLSTKAILSQGGSKRDIPEKWYRKVPEKDWPGLKKRSTRNYY